MRKSTLSICISLSLICLLALPVTYNQKGPKIRGIATISSLYTRIGFLQLPIDINRNSGKR